MKWMTKTTVDVSYSPPLFLYSLPRFVSTWLMHSSWLTISRALSMTHHLNRYSLFFILLKASSNEYQHSWAEIWLFFAQFFWALHLYWYKIGGCTAAYVSKPPTTVLEVWIFSSYKNKPWYSKSINRNNEISSNLRQPNTSKHNNKLRSRPQTSKRTSIFVHRGDQSMMEQKRIKAG